VEIVYTVVGGLVVAAILGAVGWLRPAKNRVRLRQAVCRHDWRLIEPNLGGNVVFVTPYREQCVNCGKRR
jgi:hypothetical protein